MSPGNRPHVVECYPYDVDFRRTCYNRNCSNSISYVMRPLTGRLLRFAACAARKKNRPSRARRVNASHLLRLAGQGRFLRGTEADVRFGFVPQFVADDLKADGQYERCFGQAARCSIGRRHHRRDSEPHRATAADRRLGVRLIASSWRSRIRSADSGRQLPRDCGTSVEPSSTFPRSKNAVWQLGGLSDPGRDMNWGHNSLPAARSGGTL